MFSEIIHVGITVNNVEENLALYRDTLQLKVESDFEVSGPAWEKVTGISGVKFRRITLQREGVDTGKIVLLKFSSPQSRPFPLDRKQYDLGLYDFGFESADIDKTYALLIKKGYTFDSTVQPVIAQGNTVAREASIQAPEGVRIMLVQVFYKPSATQKEEELITSEMEHVVIVAKDREKSVRFYRDILGLKVIFDNVLEGEQLDQIVRLSRAKLNVYLLGKENVNAGKVEIIQYLSHEGRPLPKDTSLSDCGLRFISFRVDDMDKAYSLLRGKGIEFLSEPIIVAMGHKNVSMALGKDFDNVFIECFQEI